jgi:hypothetical protein
VLVSYVTVTLLSVVDLADQVPTVKPLLMLLLPALAVRLPLNPPRIVVELLEIYQPQWLQPGPFVMVLRVVAPDL